MASRVPIPSLEPIVAPPRRSLTSLQRAKLFDARKGVCGICRRRIGVGERWIDEHMDPREISANDSFDNRWPVHEGCAKEKTKRDFKTIAKCRRVRARHLGIKKSRHPMPGGRDSNIKMKMDGTIVDRRTGEPIRR